MSAAKKTPAGRVLLIDIGNTNLKWAWLLGTDLSSVQSAGHRHRPMQGVAQACWQDEPRPSRVLIANVAGPEAAAELSDWMDGAWNLKPTFIRSPGSALGVTNAYSEPAQLGVDRWLTLIAVFSKKQVPACIVDCGTAVTLDVIDRSGRHLGGLILPGFNMMRDALLERTNIPRQQSDFVTDIFGCDTASAVAAGSVHAAAALIDRVLQESSRICGERPRLILTGSDVSRLHSVLAESCTLSPDLVMSGLALLAKEQPA